MTVGDIEAATVWLPYCGAAPSPAEWLMRWNLDPVLLSALVLATVVALRADTGPRRNAGLAALAAVTILYITPLCALSSALFSVRVAHHVALVTIVAPLAVTALSARMPAIGLGPATALHVATMWLWHAPDAYGWALSGDAAYWAMQLSLLATAMLFWNAARRAAAVDAVGAILMAMLATGLLGAILTFLTVPVYTPHLAGTVAWGLSPLADQRLAGLVMWVVGGALYLVAALRIAGSWLRAPMAAR